jgi:hypothetical protein
MALRLVLDIQWATRQRGAGLGATLPDIRPPPTMREQLELLPSIQGALSETTEKYLDADVYILYPIFFLFINWLSYSK